MKGQRMLLGALAGVGALSLIAVGAITLWASLGDRRGDEAPTVHDRRRSPDGAFEAVQGTVMGGGAAGWCRVFIVLHPTGQPLVLAPIHAPDGGEAVLLARCSASVSMDWQGPRELRVRYGWTSQALTYLEVRPVDKTGQVSVRFEPQTQP